MRTETKYNKVVNFDEDTKEITVLDGTFKYTTETEYKTGIESVVTMKGATGTRFEPISLEEYEDRTDEDNFVEYLIDSGMELPEDYKRTGFEGLANAMIANDEVKDFVFDTSYSELWDYLREETGLTENEAYIFNCIGGGRCFDKDFQGNKNTELSAIIREFETN